MANGFVFGPIDKVQATAGGNRRLRPWDIYEVKFVEAKYDTIEGKKEENKGQIYEMLVVRFESEDGYYEERRKALEENTRKVTEDVTLRIAKKSLLNGSTVEEVAANTDLPLEEVQKLALQIT